MNGDRKPTITADSYVGHSAANTAKFLDSKGFRYTHN